MKKRYRMGICLVLVICLLLLSACGSKQDAAAKGDQAAGKTGETTGTQATQAPTETNSTESSAVPEDNKNNLPETLSFNWKESYLRIYPYINITNLKNGKLLTNESFQDEVDYLMKLVPFGEGIMDAETVQKLSFTEAYFADSSLLLIGFNVFGTIEITDITYSDGVLTCDVTKTWSKDSRLVNGEPTTSIVYYCFIEIDTVLPEETEIVVEITDELLDEPIPSEKFKLFNEKKL